MRVVQPSRPGRDFVDWVRDNFEGALADAVLEDPRLSADLLRFYERCLDHQLRPEESLRFWIRVTTRLRARLFEQLEAELKHLDPRPRPDDDDARGSLP